MSKYTASEFDDLASSLSSITAPNSPAVDKEREFSKIIDRFSEEHVLDHDEKETLIFLARSLHADKGHYVLSDRRLHEDCGDGTKSKTVAIKAFDLADYYSKGIPAYLYSRDVTHTSELRLKALQTIVEIERSFNDLKEKVIEGLILTDGISNNKIGTSAGMQHQSIGLRRSTLKSSLQEVLVRDDVNVEDFIGRRVSILPSKKERYIIREISEGGHVILVNELNGTLADSSISRVTLA